ncbi:MAG: penicillin-binding protein 2 [Candidatus Paceibacterota bacterium]|jgi:penicillin-binding protein 2
MARRDLFLEEAVLDDLSEGLDIIERPLGRHVFFVAWMIVCVLVAGAVVRIAYLNIWNGASYQMRAFANAGQEIVLRAPRGGIYDRYGTLLVSNQPSFNVTLNLSQVLKDRAHVEDFLRTVNAIIPIDVASVTHDIVGADLEHQAYYPLAKNILMDQVVRLRNAHLAPIIIENNYERSYVNGPIFSHIIGYTGLASAYDVANNASLSLTDEVGKSGLEAQYNSWLSGTSGQAVVYEDARGNPLDTKTLHDPIPGSSLYTTIDGALQQEVYRALTNQLTTLGRTRGAALVMDTKTGAIRALVSVPSYDNNHLTSDMFTNPDGPTFNRVVSGVYSPGSTIKPLVAFAVLEEQIVSPFFKIFSPGYLDVPNPYDPAHPSRFLDWQPQGWVDLFSAIARSSDVYFYEVGGGFGSLKGLGIGRLHEYWDRFGLDQKTGVDLPGEMSGTLPDAASKEARTGQPWRLGDTYNVSIGQGDLAITPLELLRYIAAIAENGKMPTPHVLEAIKNESGKTIFAPTYSAGSISYTDAQNFSYVQKGMVDTVTQSYGTAHMLADVPWPIAAKTGSAQISNNTKENAFTVAYAPVNDPQIAVLVLIEDARQGSLNAVPVADTIFQWYVKNRVTNDTQDAELGISTAQTSSDSSSTR